MTDKKVQPNRLGGRGNRRARPIREGGLFVPNKTKLYIGGLTWAFWGDTLDGR